MKSLKNRKIRWGIIGLGNIADKFATDLLTVDDSELYAVASRTQNKANDFAIKYDAIKAYGSYEALAKDSKVDAVYIATPHVFHKENTLLCLKNGIAVLCEKPFAMNNEEVKEMIDCSKANNVLLMEALWTYFIPSYKHVLDLISGNKYGSVLKLEADFGFKSQFPESSRAIKKSLGGGSLLDIGIYPIFAALSLIGIPNKIDASATFFETGVDSSCRMTFQYPDNIEAKLECSFLNDTPTEAIIYCEHATIKLHSNFHHASKVSIITQNKKDTVNFTNKAYGYNYEIIHFNNLLKQGKIESDIMTFSFSKKLIKLLDRISQIIGLKY